MRDVGAKLEGALMMSFLVVGCRRYLLLIRLIRFFL
jgi:hypothetical protein